MIDLLTEPLIPLLEGTRIVPPARGGRKTHISTLIRWITRGARAPDGTTVRLEALRLGRRWLTSREALRRFAERLTPCLNGEGALEASPRTETQRERASRKAGDALDRLGITSN